MTIKDPKPHDITDLGAYRHLVHPELEQGPELADIFTTEFPANTTKEVITATIIGEMESDPDASARHFLHRALEEMDIVERMRELMVDQNTLRDDISEASGNRLVKVVRGLHRAKEIYDEWQETAGGMSKGDLGASLARIRDYIKDSPDKLAVIQVLRELLAAQAADPRTQDVYLLGVLFLEWYPYADEPEEDY